MSMHTSSQRKKNPSQTKPKPCPPVIRAEPRRAPPPSGAAGAGTKPKTPPTAQQAAPAALPRSAAAAHAGKHALCCKINHDADRTPASGARLTVVLSALLSTLCPSYVPNLCCGGGPARC